MTDHLKTAREALSKLGDSSTLPDVERNTLETIIRAALDQLRGDTNPQIEGLADAINNSVTYPMVNDVGFQSEHDRRVVMQAARRYLALTQPTTGDGG